MATPFESGLLNVQLFDLRREPVLREARAWFVAEFNPETFPEFVALVSSERNASVRMVLGYWDMAASLVTTGAIDGDAFRAAHGEVFATFSKVHPFLNDPAPRAESPTSASISKPWSLPRRMPRRFLRDDERLRVQWQGRCARRRRTRRKRYFKGTVRFNSSNQGRKSSSVMQGSLTERIRLDTVPEGSEFANHLGGARVCPLLGDRRATLLVPHAVVQNLPNQSA